MLDGLPLMRLVPSSIALAVLQLNLVGRATLIEAFFDVLINNVR
jgi:hypothetical protein